MIHTPLEFSSLPSNGNSRNNLRRSARQTHTKVYFDDAVNIEKVKSKMSTQSEFADIVNNEEYRSKEKPRGHLAVSKIIKSLEYGFTTRSYLKNAETLTFSSKEKCKADARNRRTIYSVLRTPVRSLV
jgi:hypothetical protein